MNRFCFSWIFALLLAPTVLVPPVSAAIVAAPVGSEQQAAQIDIMIADAKATMLVDPARTIAKAKAAERAAATLDGGQRRVAIATAQWLQGEAYVRLNDITHAEPLIDSALAAISAGPPTKLNGDVLLSRGGLHTANAQVAAALADYQQAHNIFRDIGETRSRAVALLSIALLYQEAEDYENALRYSKQASEVYRGDPQLLLTIYNNRGVCLSELGRFAEAEMQFREALALSKTMKSPVLQVQILRNIARAELKANNLAAADRTIAEKSVSARRGGVPASDGQDLSLAAQSALQHGDLPRAQALIERSFDGLDPAKTTLAFLEAHQTAYAIFRKLGNQGQALVHLEAMKRLDDQTSKLAASANTALAAARFDYANQELRIAKLKADELQRNIDFERARASMQRTIFIGIAGATVVLIGMLGFGLFTIRRSRNEVRAANIDLAATNVALGKALAAKTEFLATTSHEIRTPLNGILGMTQVMLADRSLSDPLRDRINVVHGAGVSMRALVDDILDVAKMETGNLTIEHAPVELCETVTDVTRMWAEQARGKGLSFALELADCPEHIEGDAARLRQILFNLLSNALKFTEAGSVRVVATTTGEGADRRLSLSVADTGIGIPADKHELIFESFRQVDAGTTRKFGGTGLGLSICRSLARAMGGDVLVESTPDIGSIFTLDLPLVEIAAPQVVDEVACSGLLIVDRSPIARSMLRAVLESRAGAVVFAGSIEDAIEKIAAGGVNSVLVDDATIKATTDVAASLSAIAAAAARAEAKVTLLWANLEENERQDLLATGIDAVIAKPIAGAALAEALYPSQNVDAARSQHLVSQAA